MKISALKPSKRDISGLQSASSAVHGLPGPADITRKKLDNGIVLLARPNFNSPSVVISGYLTAGGLLDPDDKLGSADFAASGLMRGTARHNFQEIYNTLETVGASLGFSGGTHTTGFSGRALAEDLDMLLELLGECLREPTFPVEQIERLRALLLTGLAIRAQDTEQMASLTFNKIIYRGHPYSRPEDGYPETITAIQIDDLTAFHRSHFGPQGMVIAVVGAVEPEMAVEKVTQLLGNWVNPGQVTPPDLPPVTQLQAITHESVIIPGKSQTDVLLGTPGPVRKDPGFIAAALGNNILGQFGMFGRIGAVVREREGLAYYAYSSLNGGIGPGPWSVSAGVNPKSVDKAINLIQSEIARFTSELVTEEELEDSKANFIGRLPLSLETNAGVAGALLNLEHFDLGLDYYLGYKDMITAITREDILEVARKYLQLDRLGIAVAGPEL